MTQKLTSDGREGGSRDGWIRFPLGAWAKWVPGISCYLDDFFTGFGWKNLVVGCYICSFTSEDIWPFHNDSMENERETTGWHFYTPVSPFQIANIILNQTEARKPKCSVSFFFYSFHNACHHHIHSACCQSNRSFFSFKRSLHLHGSNSYIIYECCGF